MKLAFTTSGDNLNAPIDSRFGRAPKYLIYDTDTKTFVVIDNSQNLNAAQGAGIQAAEAVARQDVNGLVTGHCGPNAFRVLSAAGIKIYSSTASTISEALDAFDAGSLASADSADVQGHW